MLVSGGLDSAVLLAEEAERHEIQPIYVHAGLAWETGERAMLDRFLARVRFPNPVRPLRAIVVDMRDVYAPTHWAILGTPPAFHTADEEVYLHGRNIVLIGKAAVLCATERIERLAIGTLDHNPFPDATPEFRSAMGTALSLGLAHPLTIEAPFARTTKAGVIRKGLMLDVPLELTLSCMSPLLTSTSLPRHCGRCSKCRERHLAFVELGVPDNTDYVDPTFVASLGPSNH